MIGSDIHRAVELLREGQLVAIPTETVYGLGGNALDQIAVAEIFRVKERPFFDPLIIHVSDVQDISAFTLDFPDLLRQVADAFMPGPVTLLLDRNDKIPDLITSGLPQVAIRVPSHPITRELLSQLSFPVAAPSANPFGYISPTCAQHVEDQLGAKVPYILDGGDCSVGLESTIVGIEKGHLVVYRKGGIAVERLREIDKDIVVRTHSDSNPSAPGMLKSHYAPSCPMRIIDQFSLIPEDDYNEIGVISFSEAVSGVPEHQQCILSPSRDFNEAARNLFKGMRRLDGLDLRMIYVNLLPEEDLGIAINDRLRRAAV